MGEWEPSTLANIADIIPGYAFKSKQFGERGIPVVKITDINPPYIDIQNAMKVELTDYNIEKLKKYYLYKDDFVIAMTGATIGKIGRLTVDTEAIVNQRVAKILPKEHANRQFVYYCIQGDDFQGFIQNNIDSHSAQENISGTSIGRYPVLIPSPPEQKAIASVLSSLDDKLDLLHRQNKTLEAMAETLFRQWFVEEAQEDWETVKVLDFVKTNVTSINKNCNLDTIKYLDTSSITQGRIDGYQILNIGEAPSRARRIVRHNDILISTVRPNQKHYGILKHPEENLIVSTGFCVITCENINPHFIYILLTTDDMTEYLHSIAEGSTSAYPSLKPSDIEMVEFQLPPKEKLIAFSEYADNAWNKIDYNHKQIHTLEKLRDTLLPKLMSGEARVAYENESGMEKRAM
jgi:type I restriction enzyme S subunit